MILFVLSSCTVIGPNYKPPTHTIAPNYSVKSGNKPLSEKWWESFADPQLNYLIQQARAENQDIKLAEARFKQARAGVNIQNAQFGPTLAMNTKLVEDQWSKNSAMLVNIPNNNIRTQFTNYQIGFDASWEVDLFGRLQRLSEAANARSNAQQDHVQEMLLTISAEVARHYIELRTWQQRIILANTHLKTLQELRRLTKLRQKVGEASRQECEQIEADLKNYATVLTQFNMGFQQNLTALSLLTGIQLNILETKMRPPVQLAALPEAPALGLPSDLLKRRPDIRAAEQDLMTANAEIGAAIGDLYPRFSLLGSAGWLSINASTLFNSASQTWNIGPSLSFPIFNYGRLRNQINANQAGFEMALASYRKTILNAVTEVEIALNSITENETKFKLLNEAKAKQKRLLQLTELEVKVGEMTRMDSLNIQRNLLNQEDQELQTHAQSLTSLVALYKALGGGFEQTSLKNRAALK